MNAPFRHSESRRSLQQFRSNSLAHPATQSTSRNDPLAQVPQSSTEEMIAEVRNGRTFILVDDFQRIEGAVLVVPAQMATPDAINFLADRVPPRGVSWSA
jgi:hypothetical protein